MKARKHYELEVSPAARRDLKRLPKNVQGEIVLKYLPKIKENPYRVGLPLIGALKGERAYHFGRKPEYRIVYFVEANTIIVTIIDTREIFTKELRDGDDEQ